MVGQVMNSLGSYTKEFGLDFANIWEPLKVYKEGSDLGIID